MKVEQTIRRTLLVSAAILGLGWMASAAAPSAAQEVAPLSPGELVFGEEVEVRVVNLEVVVEDRSGDRVRGLSPEDFRILVDGEGVGVQYFSEVADRRAVTSDGAETPPAVDEERAVVTNYVLFVDDDHTHVTLRRPVLRGFGARLDGLGPHDRVAVVVQSRYRLKILSRFTTDRDATRAALAELDSGGRYGGFVDSRAWRNRMKGAVRSTSGDSASSREAASLSGAQNRVYPMDQQSVRPNTSLWRNLRYVARDTGGRAFMAGSNVTALDKVSFDTSNYYWLGFVPEYRRDDRPHDIRVEVVQPGLRVRSRRGYLDLSRRVEADMEAQRALLFPSDAEPGAGPLLVELGEVETAARSGGAVAGR